MDRIPVTTPDLCHPAIAAEQEGTKARLFVVWEDIDATINQTQTSVLKCAIYEADGEGGYDPLVSDYNKEGAISNDVQFRDFVFAEGGQNWRLERLKPQYPSVIVKEPYPTFGVTWTEEPGYLIYDDITSDPLLSGALINFSPKDIIPTLRLKSGTAPSLCVQNPPNGRPFVAYQSNDGWSQWPNPTLAVSWPLSLPGNLFYPVTCIYPLWSYDPPSQILNPSRVYVRSKVNGWDDSNRQPGASDWNTLSRVLNYRTVNTNISAPSIGSTEEKLRVAVNDGYGRIAVANHDDLNSPTVYTDYYDDGYDPGVTIEGSLAMVYSLPATGFPSPLTQTVRSTTNGLTKASKTKINIDSFMRELTVRRDTSFAVYGICMPNMLRHDSTRVYIGWSTASLDTFAIRRNRSLEEFCRTTTFDVVSNAHFEYAAELYSQYVDTYEYDYDFMLQFRSSQSDSLLMENKLSVAALPSDSAWYVVHRIDISALSGKNIYVQLLISDTSSVYEVDVADIYDVPDEVAKASIQPRMVTPKHISLQQNYPNPFNPSTVISYTLPESGYVRLAVYNALGKLVKVLTDNVMSAGIHQVSFDAKGLPSGVYYYKLAAGSEHLTRQMTLLK